MQNSTFETGLSGRSMQYIGHSNMSIMAGFRNAGYNLRLYFFVTVLCAHVQLLNGSWMCGKLANLFVWFAFLSHCVHFGIEFFLSGSSLKMHMKTTS